MRRLIEIATERRVTIVMMMVAIVLFGMVSLSRLKLNLLPDISYPTVTIRTELTGAAPVEVENLLTKPIEEAVGVIRNVRLVRSVSRSGQSDVTLEFLWGTDMDIAGVDVREKLDILTLPLEASRPLLLRFDPSSEPMIHRDFPGGFDDLQEYVMEVCDGIKDHCVRDPGDGMAPAASPTATAMAVPSTMLSSRRRKVGIMPPVGSPPKVKSFARPTPRVPTSCSPSSTTRPSPCSPAVSGSTRNPTSRASGT